MHLRAKTLAELQETLDESYFTAASFVVNAVPDGFPFLEITFSPAPRYKFSMYAAEDGLVRTEESPGELLASGEERTYKTLTHALSAVRSWTRRIREEYNHATQIRTEIDEFLEQFRKRVFAAPEGENPDSAFSDPEIAELRESLDRLKELIASQAEEIKANAYQVSEFEKEIEKIKADLTGMPRGVWKKVASNKLLKSVKGFMGTPEGRALIADGLKKLIGME